MQHRPLALVILDGWGQREESDGNAIALAETPCWDKLQKECSHTLIGGSGPSVGLPKGQMGNSEVGHLNMGAGRVVYQDITRIDKAISDGNFFTNPVLTQAMQQAVDNGKAVHVLGLLSSGGVHSHENQIHALCDLAAQQGITKLYFHALLDGRDTPPRSALTSLHKLEQHLEKLGIGRIVSMTGRYYAMDRDNRWERVSTAYDLLTQGVANHQFSSVKQGLEAAYARDEGDEFLQTTSITPKGENPITIQDGDSVVFMNFRADRARQLTRALCDKDFSAFERKVIPQLGTMVTLTQYAADIPAEIAFAPIRPDNTLAEYLSNLGLKQLHIAETEKYAHVTFFFNGGREEPFPGEERILIPSPKVATYDLQPEMSAPEITEKLVQAILEERFDVIICNFANADMVGHTGHLDAAISAVETLDNCLEEVSSALKKVGGELLITADHGNVEQMFDPSTNQPHTAHTSELVPLVYMGREATVINKEGILADIAPTMLAIMGIDCPPEMTGQPIFKTKGS